MGQDVRMSSTRSLQSLSHQEIEFLENELNKLRVSTRDALSKLRNEVATLQEQCELQEDIISQFEEQVATSQFNERYWKERALDAEKRMKRQGEISKSLIKAASARNLLNREESEQILTPKEREEALLSSQSCRELTTINESSTSFASSNTDSMSERDQDRYQDRDRDRPQLLRSSGGRRIQSTSETESEAESDDSNDTDKPAPISSSTLSNRSRLRQTYTQRITMLEGNIKLLESKVAARDSIIESLGEKVDKYERLIGKVKSKVKARRSEKAKDDRIEQRQIMI